MSPVRRIRRCHEALAGLLLLAFLSLTGCIHHVLLDLHCGEQPCTITDAGEISIIAIGKDTAFTQALPHRSNREFMNAVGCGAVFVCSSDGVVVQILALKDGRE